jgi:hypothetical protein
MKKSMVLQNYQWTSLPGSSQNYILGDLYARYRVEKSFFGYDPSILKSGIQKYARRAEVEKGLWCLVDLDSFSLLEWGGIALNSYLHAYPEETPENTQIAAKRIRTNMVNRLVVMMSEEVNISAWWIPLKMLELYEKWDGNRGNTSSRKYLVDMYLYLTSQKMIRLISDLHSVFLLPPDYVKAEQMNDLRQIHSKIQHRFPTIYSGQAEIGKMDLDIDMDRYPSSLRLYIEGIAYNLEKCSDNVFYWIKKLCDLANKDGVHRYNYLKIVWDILHRFIDQNAEYEYVRQQICALEEFYKRMGHKEKPIYLYHAVLLLVRRNEIDWDSTAPTIDTPMVDVMKLYGDHLRGVKMKIDDYVLDLHTHGGKKGPGSLKKFALEGAFIKNENYHFLNKEYREIYILLKAELDLYNSRGGKLR